MDLRNVEAGLSQKLEHFNTRNLIKPSVLTQMCSMKLGPFSEEWFIEVVEKTVVEKRSGLNTVTDNSALKSSFEKPLLSSPYKCISKAKTQEGSSQKKVLSQDKEI